MWVLLGHEYGTELYLFENKVRFRQNNDKWNDFSIGVKSMSYLRLVDSSYWFIYTNLSLHISKLMYIYVQIAILYKLQNKIYHIYVMKHN